MQRYLTSITKLRFFAVVLGAVQAWSSRYEMYPDTISYLDVGTEFLNGNWQAAVHPHWSPGYSWLLAMCLTLFDSSPISQIWGIHVFQFLCYLAALAAFEFLLHRAIGRLGPQGQKEHAPLSEENDTPLVTAVAYPLFVWSALDLIGVSEGTPDLLMSVFVFLALGTLARILTPQARFAHYFLLGLFLGLGYWTKNVMFAVSGLILATTLIAVRGRDRMRALVSVLTFLAVAATLFVPMSMARGRFTLGDSARLNLAWHINGVPHYAHWQGPDEGFGAPLHPTRRILENPAVYEFAVPVSGTYPPWFDPSYWYAGVRPKFEIRLVISRFLDNLRTFMRELFLEKSFPIAATLILFLSSIAAGAAKQRRLRDSAAIFGTALQVAAYLWVPAIATIGMFLAVYFLTRYIAAFVFLSLFSLLLASRRIDRDAEWQSSCQFIGTACGLWLFLGILCIQWIADTDDHRNHCQAADALRIHGVDPGESVAHVGNSFKAYWARLARVRIVAEIRPEDGDLFFQNAESRRRSLEAFRSAGAVAVIVSSNGDAPDENGWKRLADGFWLLEL